MSGIVNNLETLILGAGPSGLAAAFELNKAQKSFIVVEKNDIVGGLSRTFQYGDFHTDVGPHRFFSQNQYLYDLISDLLGEEWIKVDRLTRFYVDGKLFMYPVDLKNAILNVGPYKAFKMIFDYSWERLKRLFIKKKLENFEDFIVADFGRTLAEFNMLNYTEKIWGLPCSQISSDWSKQRIRGLSLKAIIMKALSKTKHGPRTLVEQFYYPKRGTGSIFEKIKEKILSGNIGNVLTNSYPVKIIHDDNKINEIQLNINGEIKTYISKNVVSSIPITEFVSLLDPKAPDDVLIALKKLRFRSHVSLFVTLNKKSIFKDQWIYFPDKEIPFGRIMEPKNFSEIMSPSNRTSLLIEFFCWENDEIWDASKEKLLQISIKWLQKLGFLKREEVVDMYLHKEKYAYPVYDLEYKENLSVVKNYIKQFDNLQLIGRSGSFRYNNQDHALEMGILAARNIIENKNYDTEEVGKANEYFERGYLK